MIIMMIFKRSSENIVPQFPDNSPARPYDGDKLTIMMVTALPLRGQDRLGSGQGSVQGKQWRSCHCQQREGEHVRLFIIVILIIIVTDHHDPCQNLCHVDAKVFTRIYRKKQCKITNLSTSGTFMTLPGTMRSTSGLASPRMSMCANSWMM